MRRAPLRSVKAIVKKEIKKNTEIKQINYNATGNTNWVDGTMGVSNFFQLTAVDQGNGANQRVGQFIDIKSLHLSYQISVNGGAITINEHNPVVRVLVVQYHPLTASNPNLLTFLEHSGDSYVTMSPYSQNNQYDYTILYDKTEILSDGCQSAGVLNTGGPTRVYRNIWITGKKFMKRDVQYALTSTTQAKNNIYVFFLWNQNATGGQPPGFQFHARLRYTDA